MASGAGFYTGNASANVITLGGVPCNVTSVSRWELTCVSGPIYNSFMVS